LWDGKPPKCVLVIAKKGNMKPTALPVLTQNIPATLKKVPRWVMWSFIEVGEGESKRWSKMPLQTNGRPASSTNPDTWSDFLNVEDAYNTGKFSGIGFVFSKDDDLVGIDLDDCYSSAGLSDFAQNVVDQVQGYTEISPSGTGVKIFTRSTLFASHADHSIGFEAYATGRFFTITGNKLSGTIPDEPQDLTGIIPARALRETGDAFGDYNAPLEEWDLTRVETELLSKLDPDMGYSDWLKIGAMLHHQFAGDVEACEAWDRWSQGGDEYTATGEYSCENKWRTFKGSGATLRSMIFQVNQQTREEALARGEIILDTGAMNHARTFLDNYYSSEEGYRLVHYSDDFYIYVGTHYEIIEEATIRSKVYNFLDKCKKSGKQGSLVPFNPSPASVSAAIDAIKSIVHLANHPNTKPPIWLEAYYKNKPEASKLVSLKNGLFHLEDSILIPHSLGFFTQNALPFAYDPMATAPTWESFLQSVWPDDQQSIECLQEMFGYIISGDTRQQKFFNVIGPRRSGKGTINKVLVALLGQHNTVAPELGELCDTFGLQPWLGKLLASFTDARAPERNRSAVVSQLLRIVGGDTITVNRKNKEAWNGYLPTRLVVYSNEVLQLTENSNALTGRMVVLKMTRTFYNKEDTDLAHKLEQELGGIFNWAIEGLKRRIGRGGHFVQPDSGKEYLELMSELGNPIGSFVEDALIFDPMATVSKDDVFACFKHWALKKSMAPGTEQAFKRRFLAATQEHFVRSDLLRAGGDRSHVYVGVKFNEKAQKFLDSIQRFDEDVF
jgi:P4 family phage/plasmid primase-like protien